MHKKQIERYINYIDGKEFLILISIVSGFYVFSLFPVFSTGDGGELITSAYMFGVAHPPGYPVYVEIGKLFTAIPVGNIGIKVSLLSVFFSALSLYLLYRIVILITGDKLTGLLSILILASAYSYYYNSVVAKFYTLNLFFVLLLFFIATKSVIDKNLDRKDLFLGSFILGLSTTVHHSALGMALPLLIVGLIHYRTFFKNLHFSIIFFLLGTLPNIHLYIRSMKENNFIAIHRADNIQALYELITRKFYSSSSIDTVKYVVSSNQDITIPLKNLTIVLNSNLSYSWIFLTIPGLIYIYRINRSLFAIFVALIFVYGFLMAKISLSGEYDFSMAFISANQYFLPLLAVKAIVISLGALFIVSFLKSKIKLQLTKVLHLSFFIPFIVSGYISFNLSNQSKNWVPYYQAKDILSFTPISSLFLTYGDDHNFGLWYMKVLGRYRDDVCHVVIYDYPQTFFRRQGCKPFSMYKSMVGDIFDYDNLKRLSDSYRFLSTVGLSEAQPLSKIFDHYPYMFIFFYIDKSKDKIIEQSFIDKEVVEKSKYLTYDVCLNHDTDDLFTMNLCIWVANGLLSIASSTKPFILLEQDKILFEKNNQYGKYSASYTFTVYKNFINSMYIEEYNKILNYNKIDRFFMINSR